MAHCKGRNINYSSSGFIIKAIVSVFIVVMMVIFTVINYCHYLDIVIVATAAMHDYLPPFIIFIPYYHYYYSTTIRSYLRHHY